MAAVQYECARAGKRAVLTYCSAVAQQHDMLQGVLQQRVGRKLRAPIHIAKQAAAALPLPTQLAELASSALGHPQTATGTPCNPTSRHTLQSN